MVACEQVCGGNSTRRSVFRFWPGKRLDEFRCGHSLPGLQRLPGGWQSQKLDQQTRVLTNSSSTRAAVKQPKDRAQRGFSKSMVVQVPLGGDHSQFVPVGKPQAHKIMHAPRVHSNGEDAPCSCQRKDDNTIYDCVVLLGTHQWQR